MYVINTLLVYEILYSFYIDPIVLPLNLFYTENVQTENFLFSINTSLKTFALSTGYGLYF